jgi:hypothetical protein
MTTEPLIFHTTSKEFSGDTPEAVVQAMYEDAKAPTGLNYDEWWKYKQNACRILSGGTAEPVPESNAPGAAKKLLDILVSIEAIDVGPKPEVRATGTGRDR